MGFSGEGVFANCINEKAFLDRIVVSVAGTKKESSEGVREVRNVAIGGQGKKYARKETGLLDCGNSYDLSYGRLQSVLPAMMFTVRSDQAPTTAKVVVNAINAVCERNAEAKISLVEVTFDTTGRPIEYFRRCVFSSARSFRSLRDANNWRTYYVGTRNSPWQVRIYQKTEDVIRVEFVLRRPFLRQYEVSKLEDLKKLRTLDFSRRLWLREPDSAALRELEIKVGAKDTFEVRARILSRWFSDLPLRQAIQAAKKSFGAVPQALITMSPVDEQLRRMQRRLVV